MKKRIIISILSLSFLIGILLLPLTTYASQDKNWNNIYIITKKCPIDYFEYVASNIKDFILSVDPSELPKSGSITIGTPFSFGNTDSDIFYFPVLCDDEIIYTFRVFPKASGGYGGILSKAFVSELNAFSLKTSIDRPLIFMMENDSVVAYIGTSRKVLLNYPSGTVDCKSNITVNNFSKALFSNSSNYEVVNIVKNTDIINYSISANELGSNIKLDSGNIPDYKYLSTSIIETQGSQTWCAAFATAWIIRYVKGDNDNTKAIDVMSYHFQNPSPTDSIGPEEVVEYANSRSLYPTYLKSTLSNSSLIEQIASYKPVYLRMYRTSGSKKIYHAIVLRGYNINTSKWSVWNPWYNYYDTFDMGGTYVPAEHTSREYTYFQTVYNW